jgi:hypothetical protein
MNRLIEVYSKIGTKGNDDTKTAEIFENISISSFPQEIKEDVLERLMQKVVSGDQSSIKTLNTLGYKFHIKPPQTTCPLGCTCNKVYSFDTNGDLKTFSGESLSQKP